MMDYTVLDLEETKMALLHVARYPEVEKWIHKIKSRIEAHKPHKLRVEDGRLVREPDCIVVDTLAALAAQENYQDDYVLNAIR